MQIIHAHGALRMRDGSPLPDPEFGGQEPRTWVVAGFEDLGQHPHMAGFEWDSRKEDNLRKHHFDFTSATLVWAGPVVEKIDYHREYGEPASSPLVTSAEVSSSWFTRGAVKIAALFE